MRRDRPGQPGAPERPLGAGVGHGPAGFQRLWFARGGVQAGPAGLAGPMVGRDNELARVATLLDHAQAGHGRLVLCTGEAGIGKTRLAEELAALAVAESSGDLLALVDALRARQLACCAPEGAAERAVLAQRLLDAAASTGSAWVEMSGRLWRIDTLFETGQLRSIQHELTDLEICLERVRDPTGRWHLLHCSATLAQATGRFTEAERLAGEAFKLMSDMSLEIAYGGRAVILSQAGLHVGCEASGLIEYFRGLPDRFRPDAVDTTRGLATIFPALTVALIRLDQGDLGGAAAAYALAGPPRSWTPSPAMRMAAWGHALPIAIGLGRQEDIEFLGGQFEPFRGQHAANGAGSGVYMGPVELQLGLAAAALGRLDAAVADLQAAVSICDANGACGYGVQASTELAAALARRRAPGDVDQARAVLARAATEAARLGMAPFTRRIEHLRAQLPGTVTARSPLSPREHEVARLVARGLTNKQIGQALYVSERTAENHVQHILTKLGFSSRSQIAAWSSGAQAADGPGP